MITLYEIGRSGNCHKVRLLHSLLALAYETHPINLAAGENRTRAEKPATAAKVGRASDRQLAQSVTATTLAIINQQPARAGLADWRCGIDCRHCPLTAPRSPKGGVDLLPYANVRRWFAARRRRRDDVGMAGICACVSTGRRAVARRVLAPAHE